MSAEVATSRGLVEPGCHVAAVESLRLPVPVHNGGNASVEFVIVRALFRRDQGALVFGGAELAAALASLPAGITLGFGMRTFAAGRQRRIAWGLVQTCLDFGESSQQGADDGLGLGGVWQAISYSVMSRVMMPLSEVRSCEASPNRQKDDPGCERLRLRSSFLQ